MSADLLSANPVLDAALRALDAGLSIVPVAGKKPFGSWSRFMRSPMSADEARHRLGKPEVTGFGLVGGAVSCGLEILDFESDTALRELRGLAQEQGCGELVARVEAGYCVRTARGWHLAIRCPETVIDGNTELAHALVEGQPKVKIETRGEGGQAVAPPSPHPSGARYELAHGGFGTIAIVSPEERQALLALCRALTEVELPTKRAAQPTTHRVDRSRGLYDDLSPAEEFCSTHSWADVLEPHGWTRAPGGRWRRPDAESESSANELEDGKLLHVHSTNAYPLEASVTYTRFRAHAALNHGGDLAAAAKEIVLARTPRRDGREIAQTLYHAWLNGEPDAETVEHVEQIDPDPQIEADVGSFPKELFRMSGQLGVLWRHLVETAPSPQPELALGAALVALGTVVGRKVRTPSGLRSNLYVMGVAPTGAGKEYARKVIKDLFHEIGAFRRVANDKLASDAAIWSAMSESESSLFMIDEASRLLARLNAKNAPAHIESQIDAYLSLYSQADQIAVSKTYADLSKRTEIVQPCLSLYMTTTPGPLFEAMSGANVEDGFLSRFLVFGSVERPIPRDVEPAPLPESVVSCFRHWEEFEPPTDKTLFKTPQPVVVHPDDEARQIFADFTARMHERSASNVLFTRAAVQAWKIALIGACGTGKEPAISGPLAQWACELVEYLLSRFAAQLEERSGHNDRERHLKELAKFIRERKKVTAREITRRFQRWDRRMRDELIADLRDAGRIEISESKSRGPASKTVTWTVSPRKTVSEGESGATTVT